MLEVCSLEKFKDDRRKEVLGQFKEICKIDSIVSIKVGHQNAVVISFGSLPKFTTQHKKVSKLDDTVEVGIANKTSRRVNGGEDGRVSENLTNALRKFPAMHSA